MEAGRPSATAISCARQRAMHLLLDDDPKILQDDLAMVLSGAEDEEALRAAWEARLAEVAQRISPNFSQAVSRNSRAALVMRSRYTEDALSQAIERGVAQYVILGAGLDSFAYRRQDLSSVLHVFEVDHPATQEWKQARLSTLNIKMPSNLTFVPVDFEQQTLAEVLPVSGFRADLPAFFSWLGVTYYLTEAAVFETLRYVASLAPGSEIVFEYWLPDALLDEEGRQYLAKLQELVASLGEPIQTSFDPIDLMARLKAMGFIQAQDFGTKDAFMRYFANRTDELHLAKRIAHLMKARVGPGSL